MEKQNKYFLFDIETGFKYEVSEQQYKQHMNAWEIAVPKINHIVGIPLIYGTSGEINNGDIKEWFYSM